MRQQLDHVNQSGAAGDRPPDDLLEALHAVMHRVRALHHAAPAGRDGAPEITPLEGRVLAFFARHPGATQRELAEHSGRDKGQLARLLAGLRERGLLEAEADAHDGRVTRLRLSAAAQQQHLAVQRQRKRLLAAAVNGLSADERQTLLALLARVRHNLDALA